MRKSSQDLGPLLDPAGVSTTKERDILLKEAMPGPRTRQEVLRKRTAVVELDLSQLPAPWGGRPRTSGECLLRSKGTVWQL